MKSQTLSVELLNIYVRMLFLTFIAPEMVNGTGHDHTLDWWTLGVLIYEMIVGIPPFYNQNKHQMYYLIENGQIRWP
jgi:serum/glucocorticoid-regulated kinase 2